MSARTFFRSPSTTALFKGETEAHPAAKRRAKMSKRIRGRVFRLDAFIFRMAGPPGTVAREGLFLDWL
jgi:hypothetical protein